MPWLLVAHRGGGAVDPTMQLVSRALSDVQDTRAAAGTHARSHGRSPASGGFPLLSLPHEVLDHLIRCHVPSALDRAALARCDEASHGIVQPLLTPILTLANFVVNHRNFQAHIQGHADRYHRYYEPVEPWHPTTVFCKDELQQLCTMTALQLDGCRGGLDADDVQALVRSAVCGCLPALQQFSVRVNEIGDAGLVALADKIGALPRLESLALNRNQIGPIGTTALANAMDNGGLPRLKELRLNANHLGDEGMVALAPALARGTPLITTLFLEANLIGDRGVTALVDALARVGDGELRLPHLVVLALSMNCIDDAGVRYLAAALAGGDLPSLQRLMVGTNRSKSVKAFQQLQTACHARRITGSTFLRAPIHRSLAVSPIFEFE